MNFKKYQHLEKLESTEVDGIDIGTCYFFPKIDGTNASIWDNNSSIEAGSRKRKLTLEDDNAGFYKWVLQQENICNFLKDYPYLRLYGEWLVPHTLKTYLHSAWRDFYVFDVVFEDPYVEYKQYLEYEDYKALLDIYNINYIPPICKIKNPTKERILDIINHNTYLIKDGEGLGEGVVIKNYNFKNKFGHVVWAKVIRSEFKASHQKKFTCKIKEKNTSEEQIVEEYVTIELIEKELAKIRNEVGWSSKMIPRLLNTVFYCLIKEESWNYVKKMKCPVVDYKRLKGLTFAMVKEIKSELF